MNCQDITRLIDSGKFSALTADERSAAQTHALSCQHCAPLWIMHASVAVTQVPATPAELSVRCLTLAAAAKTAAAPRRVSRVMMVMGGFIVLAAAASMLLVNVADAPAPQPDEFAGQTAATTSVTAPLPQVSAPPAESAAPSASQEQPVASIQRAIPLFPLPLAADQAFVIRRKMALEKLVELYPELTQAQATGTVFIAAITLRGDGTVLDHAMRPATRDTFRQVNEELERRMPVDGGEPFLDSAPKGTQLADGRTIGANLSFHHLTVRNTYDPARSSLRVDQIMRAQRPALMLPASRAGGSHVIILLSRDGAILREVAGFIGGEELQQRNNMNVTERAEDMARRLGISANEIGLMGYKYIGDDANRAMFVDYAWKRLPGESAPEYRQGGGSQTDEGIDLDAAAALVERVMPDAFMGEEVERALGMPAILLSEEGVFIRGARLNRATAPDKRVSEAFAGVPITSFRILVLTSGKGAKSAVMFVWQGAPK